MSIRKAQLKDNQSIQVLLSQLGYPDTGGFLLDKMKLMLADKNGILLVYELESEVVAFISVHFIPQIALPGDFARISYFSVLEEVRSKGIGREIENYITGVAMDRRCDRIEVHCHSRRSDAHRFYINRGFEEFPKYLIKKLV
jgi:GNAT superfamily N-acetyltransferase